jgi:dGTPase
MDWADDLTYAIHDVEDFYRAGLIPLHLLHRPEAGSRGSTDCEEFLEYVSRKKSIIDELQGSCDDEIDEILEILLFSHFKLSGPYQGTSSDRAQLRTFTSQLVGRYINGLTLIEPKSDGVSIHADDDYRKEIALLKQLTWHYVIEAPGLAVQQYAQRKVIQYLFETFLEEVSKSPSPLIPPYYRERLKQIASDSNGARRVVIDLIAGMTESQAFITYQRLNGIVNGSALDRLTV